MDNVYVDDINKLFNKFHNFSKNKNLLDTSKKNIKNHDFNKTSYDFKNHQMRMKQYFFKKNSRKNIIIEDDKKNENIKIVENLEEYFKNYS